MLNRQLSVGQAMVKELGSFSRPSEWHLGPSNSYHLKTNSYHRTTAIPVYVPIFPAQLFKLLTTTSLSFGRSTTYSQLSSASQSSEAGNYRLL